MRTTFQCGLAVCDACPSPDGWGWIALVSVDRQHPLHGRCFVDFGLHCMNHVSHSTGSMSYDERWWFTIDDGHVHADEDSVLQTIGWASGVITYGADTRIRS